VIDRAIVIVKAQERGFMKIIFENKDLVGMGEAAKELGISPMTLHRWVVSGRIMAIRIGSYRVIPVSEIERLKISANEEVV